MRFISSLQRFQACFLHRFCIFPRSSLHLCPHHYLLPEAWHEMCPLKMWKRHMNEFMGWNESELTLASSPSFSQADVPRAEVESLGPEPISPLHPPPGHHPGRQLPLPLPGRRLAGRWRCRGKATRPSLHPPGLTGHWGSLAEPHHLVSLCQAHQQHTGHTGTCKHSRNIVPSVDWQILSSWCILSQFPFCSADNLTLAASLPAQNSCDRSQRCAEVGRRSTLFRFPWDPVHHSHRLPEQQGTKIIHTHIYMYTKKEHKQKRRWTNCKILFCCCFQITELKINANPFAKGFREEGMNSKK